MKNNTVFIKEIFESIQGEGLYVGVNQLFVRFSKCNLHCKYCDTDFKTDLKEYSCENLAVEINKYENIHSVSLTGGEPLVNSEFLNNLFPLLNNKKIYLETNGTLYNELENVIKYIDIISADIKLDSCSGNGNLFELHDKFANMAVKNNKEIFFKVVFNENITEEEISSTINIAKKYSLPLILQPETKNDKINISEDNLQKIFKKFNNEYAKVRIIPQVHKFINVK